MAGGEAALFALLGAAYYVLVYTLLLKPRTALSSVPGALAGVFPALIGWAATGAAWSGDILFLCAVVFVWSPPHFWALSLTREDDYRASGIPTPAGALRRTRHAPVDRRLRRGPHGRRRGGGRERSLRRAASTSIALVATVVLWVFVARLLTAQSGPAAWALFKVSGPWLAALVAAAVLDRML